MKRRKWCGMHYERWRRHGDPMIVVTPRRNATHRMTGTPEFGTWIHMRSRCLTLTDDAYHLYGGRGITIYGPWIESFEAFFAYIGPKPGPNYSIDRIDNDGNYEPGNVRWATPREQIRNQRHAKRSQTACLKGHPFDEENTYRSPQGYRRCRKCRKLRDDAKRAERDS